MIRLVKVISHSGLCSRREAEKLIINGDVQLEGKIYKNYVIEPNLINKITIKGEKLKLQPTRLWLLHKSVGLICSNSNQYNKKTIFEVLPKSLPRVVSVGRLDINSEGLILLTNNPTLSTFLENPKNNIPRKYRVKIHGEIERNKIQFLSKEFEIDNTKYKPFIIKIILKDKKFSELEIIISEGKNREIRKALKFLKVKIIVLKRVDYGPFKLLNIKVNELCEVEKNELDRKLLSIAFKNENHLW